MAIFVVVALVSAGALAVLVRLLFEQERAVETQRKQERLEQAGERVVKGMQDALADLRARVVQGGADLPEAVTVVRVRGNEIDVRPEGGLRYYPEVPPNNFAPDPQVSAAERLEFAGNAASADRAVDAYERLAGNSRREIRAAAFNGLARLFRKRGNLDAALRNYDRLAQMADLRIDGLPSKLVAIVGRASAFEETGQKASLLQEANLLEENLRQGRWRLVQSEYLFYSQVAKDWLGASGASVAEDDEQDGFVRTEAFAWFWRNQPWKDQNESGSAAWRWINAGGISALTLWNFTPSESTVIVAGSTYLNSVCEKSFHDPAFRCTLSDAEGHIVSGAPATRPFANVAAAMPGLPWNLQVSFSSDADTGTSSQRILLTWLFVVLIGVWGTAAWFIMRAIAREMRVARLQSDFVAAVSHEFRSPLTSVSQLSEMLATGRLETDDLRKKAYLVMTRESERLRGLVESLLDFGRMEDGRALYHFEPLRIGGFLQELVADFRERVSPAGYSVDLTLPETELIVNADREALSRAILNLLDNAVKYSPACHSVWVDVERRGDFAAITVRDRGLGIPVQEQSEVFEKFVRGTNIEGLQIKGTGIGLATVRHIIRAHGGEIQIASELGQGSSFTMILPEKS
jgi:signal transduction histidine kinase